MKNLVIAAAALGLACTIAAPTLAHAQTGVRERMTLSVPIDDINLATPAGQAQLDRRLERAAREVCGMNDAQTGTRIKSQDARACLARARADARQQVAKLTEVRQRGV